MMLTMSTCAQQDSQYTQYIFNGIHINPAYSGYKEELYVQSFYRAQWAGVKGAPKSLSVAGDMPLNDNNVGLGLIISSDQVGAQSNLSGYANYAYKIRLGYDGERHLSFGIAAGFMQLGLNTGKLNAIDNSDDAISTTTETRILPDARFGVYYTAERYFAGFSVANMLARYAARNNSSNLLVPVPQPHLYFTTGALFPLNNGMTFKPTLLLKDDLKGPASLDINSFLLLGDKVWLGAFYRTAISYSRKHLPDNLTKRTALGGLFELFVSPAFRVGYSYDYALNALQNNNFGSHEISVGLYLNTGHAKRPGALRCYKF